MYLPMVQSNENKLHHLILALIILKLLAYHFILLSPPKVTLITHHFPSQSHLFLGLQLFSFLSKLSKFTKLSEH